MTAPDQKPEETAEAFLSRWSQRKQQARQEAQNQPAPPAEPREAPPPELPAVEQLNRDSDYRGFLHPKVDESLRRAALKKLFSDPHFNIMDGLDIYIDDYSVSDPIPAAMLAEMKSAQNILGWARETEEEAVARRSLPDAESTRAVNAEPEPGAAGVVAGHEEAVAESGVGSGPVVATQPKADPPASDDPQSA